MKAQKLTKALLKPGASFWGARVETDLDTGKSSVEIIEWKIKSILNRRPQKDLPPVPTAFFVQKVDGLTWVKLSKKTGDYGWAPNIAEIQRSSCHVGHELPSGLATTKAKACELAKAKLESRNDQRMRIAKQYALAIPDDDPDYVAELNQERAIISRAIAYWKGKEGKCS